MDWDVFNGDADGVCSLIQLRLEDPRPNAMLVTGVKRDIKLLKRVTADAGDRVTVLDISLAKNRDELERVLGAGAEVLYADHHDPGERFGHERLDQHIVTKGEMCTAAIVDNLLDGAQRDWAVVGAFGDNMNAMAERLAEGRGLPLEAIRELGNLINYNGYGASLEDLHYHPDALYKLMLAHGSPLSALEGDEIAVLREGFQSDRAAAEDADVVFQNEAALAVVLPDGAPSRRIGGVWGNILASANPDRAHAILTDRGGVFTVSIRAPINTRRGAVDLANQFETGGGRAAAAGINDLPESDLDRFLKAFDAAFPVVA